MLTNIKDQKRQAERVAQRATLFRTLNAELNDKLSFVDFVKQKRDAAAADAAADGDRLFNLLTDDELVAEKLVRRARILWSRRNILSLLQFVLCYDHENACAAHRRVCSMATTSTATAS